ncbi:hypothetical protein K3165_12805 [Qipengyuania sp. 1XM1-15A]|uniref:hypothetical protein n=1 Tax=Qipengyuania xiamenensis TaxID=2867237 RepID=UPI001C88251B|nr:hypothetical protein [Qipengyuania xiamenensis]MBX7533808.1 hypothetical protein [Qipengyuania xiamenensis]
MKSMSNRKLVVLSALLAAVPAAVFGGPALAQSSLAMLDTLEKGAWEVRFRDGTAPRSICVRSGRELIQLRHSESGCNRFVVEDGANEVTVQYTCRGNGYGRTNIRKEGSNLVQIDSQGIADGRPFQFSAEARRTGSCR